MSGYRDVLERSRRSFRPSQLDLDVVYRHRDRKQRNGRIAAGLLALALTVGGGLVALSTIRSGSNTGGNTTPSPAPLVSPRSGIAFISGSSLYTIDPDGTDLERIVGCPASACEAISDPSWSPDGTRIAFSQMDSSDLTSDIWVVGADGSDPARITDCVGGVTGPLGSRHACVDSDPAWSPDGDTILFTRNFYLYKVDADGSSPMPLPVGMSVSSPTWSPQGGKIAFSDTERGLVYVANADGSDIEVLVKSHDAAEGPGSPSWSPDGTRIAFFRTPRPDGGFIGEVWVVNVDDSQRTRLFSSVCCIEDWGGPVWSSDGREIAFVVDEGKGGRLMVMASDGSGVRRLAPAIGGVSWR